MTRLLPVVRYSHFPWLDALILANPFHPDTSNIPVTTSTTTISVKKEKSKFATSSTFTKTTTTTTPVPTARKPIVIQRLGRGSSGPVSPPNISSRMPSVAASTAPEPKVLTPVAVQDRSGPGTPISPPRVSSRTPSLSSVSARLSALSLDFPDPLSSANLARVGTESGISRSQYRSERKGPSSVGPPPTSTTSTRQRERQSSAFRSGNNPPSEPPVAVPSAPISGKWYVVTSGRRTGVFDDWYSFFLLLECVINLFFVS